MPSTLAGIFLALFSAVSWGSGDFVGGLATRKLHVMQVLFLSATFGMFAQLALALAWGEPFPARADIIWAMGAGFGGFFGLSVLYYGLAHAQSAVVTTVSSLTSAALLVLLGYTQSGAPSNFQFAGILCGLAGIILLTWLPTALPSTGPVPAMSRSIWLGVASGLGFAVFFGMVVQVDDHFIFAPLVATRLVSVLASLGFLLALRQPLPSPTQNPVALLAGLLDAGGNVLFLAATARARLDVVSVLAATYPAFTVLLGALVLREHIRRRQWLGILLCVSAAALFGLN